MVFYMREESKPYIMSLDIEYEGQNIIQIGAIMLQWIGEHVYQICRSFNVYIKHDSPLSNFVQKYTNITNQFINDYGVTLDEAIQQWDYFLEGIDHDDILIFSHGVFQDIDLLDRSGFNIEDYELWDTLNMSKFILQREHHLTLQELAEEGGFPPVQQHNAYSDALTNLMLYSYLLKLQGDD